MIKKMMDLLPEGIRDNFVDVFFKDKSQYKVEGIDFEASIDGTFLLADRTFTSCLVRGLIFNENSLAVTHLEYNDGDMLSESIIINSEEDKE